MQIVVRFPVLVEQLAVAVRTLPSVEELRPSCCAGCGQPSRPAGQPLLLIGHGTYRRMVLGVHEATRETVILVRRYLCKACRATMSVLPDEVYPRRWYAAGAILLALALSLGRGWTAAAVRERLGQLSDTPGWRTLWRWRGQLLQPMWSWFSRELGCGESGAELRDAGEGLRRLLGRAGVDARVEDGRILAAARALTRDTVHRGRDGRLVAHAAPVRSG